MVFEILGRGPFSSASRSGVLGAVRHTHCVIIKKSDNNRIFIDCGEQKGYNNHSVEIEEYFLSFFNQSCVM